MMRIFEIHRDLDHLVDMSYDISLIPFEGSNSFRNKLRQTEIIDIQRPIEFFGNISALQNDTDFPISSPSMLVMSQFLIDVLSQVKYLNIKLYPTIIIDDTYLGGVRNEAGRLKEEVSVINSFPLVQILDKLKILDYDKSVYKEMNEWELFPTFVSKYVFKEPKDGFPPLFRVFEKPSSIFISEEAKKVLEANNIKGCIFEEVEVTSYEESQDA